MPRRLSLSLSALVAGVALLASACGGSSGASPEVASIDNTATDDGSGVTTTTAVDFQDAMLQMAQCLRDNGLDVDDPTFDANGNPTGGGFIVGGPGSAIDPSDEATRAAMDQCSEIMQNVRPQNGGPGGGLIDRDAVQESMNEFTSCLRDGGLDVDDFEFGPPPGADGDGPRTSIVEGGATGDGPQGGFGPGGGGPGAGGPNGEGFDPTERMIEQLGLDADDPAVQAALDSCQSILESAFQPVTSTTTA